MATLSPQLRGVDAHVGSPVPLTRSDVITSCRHTTGGRMPSPSPGRGSPAMKLRFRVGREILGKDVVAGLVFGVESVPDGLAAGLLAGVNALSGLRVPKLTV